MVEAEDFATFVESRLPHGNQIRIYHVSTRAAPCSPLFAPAPARPGEATTLESHFLTVSQSPHQDDHPAGSPSDVLVLGIEVLIFSTLNLTTVFVSKADSTGLLEKAAGAASYGTSLAQTVITAFLDFLVTPRLDRGRLVLSLFARAQNQYLFPGSIENATKHVLDDRQLIKWWCRILDPLVRQAIHPGLRSVNAHVVVPGCDSSETKIFFPSSTRADPASDPVWSNSYPVNLLVQDISLPPRCLVPRLPDDPKSRFLEDLDAQCDDNGIWRGIKSLDQFWEMMSYRQECSAGRLVGFVWVVFTPVVRVPVTNGTIDDEISTRQVDQDRPGNGSVAEPEKLLVASTVPVLHEAYSTGYTVDIPVPLTTGPAASPLTMSTQPDAGQLPKVMLTEKSRPEPGADAEDLLDVLQTGEVMTSSSSKPLTPLVLSSESYQALMDELLELDFAGKQLATENTEKWRQKAMELAHVTQFGVEVHGTLHALKASTITDDTSQKTVNVLTGIRKKRKAEPTDAVTNGNKPEVATVNTLATNLVRKKPKA